MTTRLTQNVGEPTLEVEASLPLAHEMLWGLDWIALRRSPVYRGEGVPHGRGEQVILVPGFLGSYGQLYELRNWLGRIGYEVADPGFERNVQCPDILLTELEERIAGLHATTQERVRLVGHSLGGSLARAAAISMPDHVSHVVTLGSPLRSVRAHPLVVELAQALAIVQPSRHLPHSSHEHGATCALELAQALTSEFPLNVRRAAVYSRRDGVVDWHTCVEGDESVDVEITGTHVGMIVHPGSYRAIADALSLPPNTTVGRHAN